MNINELGWHPVFEAHFQILGLSEDCIPARVSRQERGQSTLLTANGVWRGHLPQRHHFRGELTPVVGDWVAARPLPGEDAAVIEAVLPRRSKFQRTEAGGRSVPQVIAANIDTIVIVQSLERAPNLRRLERYLSLAWDCGAAPLIALSKSDLCDDLDGARADVEALGLLPEDVVVVSALMKGGVDPLERHLKSGRTLALIGPSGAGKSTLINHLMGAQHMRTHAVRDGDARGRHTTTHREMIVSPGRGVLIDTPGMREIALSDDADVGSTFADIEAFAQDCRFRDCTHHDEPDCGVLGAIDRGLLDEGRLVSFNKLQRELAYIARRSDELSKREAIAQHQTRMRRCREISRTARAIKKSRRY